MEKETKTQIIAQSVMYNFESGFGTAHIEVRMLFRDPWTLMLPYIPTQSSLNTSVMCIKCTMHVPPYTHTLFTLVAREAEHLLKKYLSNMFAGFYDTS